MSNDLTPTQSLVETNRQNGWPDLTDQVRAIAMEYVASGYSMASVMKELDISRETVSRTLKQPLVKAYVAELQKDDYTSAMISRSFVQSSLLAMLPKLAGEEDVPMVDSNGDQIYRKKFFPGEMKGVLETLGKSTDFQQDQGGTGGVNVQINFGDVLSGEGKVPNVTIDNGGPNAD
jgi:predicted DNA-binding protein YlxM (UPF0122 family)